MKLRIIGCHGGESPKHLTTCFRIDEHILLDAGAVTRGLEVSEQLKIDHIVISHSHLDHIKDLAILADNVIGGRKGPVTVHCSPDTAEVLTRFYFNNRTWPDFTRIPTPDNPVIRIEVFETGRPFKFGGYTFDTVKVNHPVHCVATFVSSSKGTLVYSGDTGATEELWPKINAVKNLKGFIYEVSFPNEMPELAQVSGHLTPQTMAEELRANYRQPASVPIFIYHLKPPTYDVTLKQVKALKDKRLIVLKPKDEYEL
jgi:ribonuclease BN (tRNA processing enzyme)